MATVNNKTVVSATSSAAVALTAEQTAAARKAAARKEAFTAVLNRLARTHCPEYRNVVELAIEKKKPSQTPNRIILLGCGEEVSNSPTNALMSMGEYALYRLEGKTQEEVMASDDLRFFAVVAHYGASVSIKTANSAEVTADKSKQRAGRLTRFANAVKTASAGLFASK